MKDNTNLVKLDMPAQVLAVKKIFDDHGGRSADAAIMAIADANEDSAAMAIVRELSPHEVARIIKDHDATVPSITAWLLDPEKAIAILEKDPSKWEKNLKEIDVLSFQSDILNLLAMIIVSNPNETAVKEILEGIMANEFAFFYLCFPYIGQELDIDGQNGTIEFNEDPEYKVGVQNDLSYQQLLQELFAKIYDLLPDLAVKLQHTIEDEFAASPWISIIENYYDLKCEANRKIKESERPDDDRDFDEMFEKKSK